MELELIVILREYPSMQLGSLNPRRHIASVETISGRAYMPT